MAETALTSLSPLDGRYANKVAPLRDYFSEHALIYYRLLVEVRWFETLANCKEITELPPLSDDAKTYLQGLLDNFSMQDALKIKTIEKTTNHDVKAIEYFLKDAIAAYSELSPAKEFVHFACTSEDINNLAYALMLKEALSDVLLPSIQQVIEQIKSFAHDYADAAMLAYTHGQAASPTTMGKEFANFAYRLQRQLFHLKKAPLLGKINGAVGNFNAHVCVYPNVNWMYISQSFVESLGLTWNPYTTQIESHDYLSEIFHIFIQANSILIDFNRDIWGYISRGYLKQKAKAGETGSSTMPHKVNPIDFENSEGNLGLANALLDHLARQLPTSRWQRDLVDSTTLRNMGSVFGYCYLAYQNCFVGMSKLALNTAQLEKELAENWEILAEAIQTMMRRHGIANPYETLKELTRGKKITQAMFTSFIEKLPLTENDKAILLALTPSTYLGVAQKLASKI